MCTGECLHDGWMLLLTVYCIKTCATMLHANQLEGTNSHSCFPEIMQTKEGFVGLSKRSSSGESKLGGEKIYEH